MKRPWLILWLFCSIPAALAEEPSTAIVTSPEAQEILDRWQLQAQSKHSSARRWEIVRQSRSANFGDGDAANETSLFVSVIHEGDEWRLEGESIAPSSLSQMTLGLTRKEDRNSEEFLSALSDRFQQATPFPDRVPYLFISNQSDERHIWWKKTAPTPAAVAICPPGASAACFERPLFSYLLEAERCLGGTGMASSADQPVEYSLLPETRPIAGMPCRVLQVWKNHEQSPQLLREFWLETGDEIRLRRCRLFSPDLVLMHYDESGPSASLKISLMRRNGSGEITEQLVAIAQPVVAMKGSAGIQWNSSFPEGTLVADFVRGERLMAAKDGDFRPITMDDVALSTFDVMGRRFEQLNLERPLVVTLIRWFSWPRVLIPLGSVCLAWGWLSTVISKRRAAARDDPATVVAVEREMHEQQS